jgi:TetR/AcrR family transcriptional regulator, transcriptional repressor for nem operon
MKTSTKKRILKSAEKLIQTRGVNDVSFQEISNDVGIQKPSLYHHFSSKEDMICQLIEHCQKNYGDIQKKIASGDDSAFEKLAALAKVFENGLKGGKACLIGMLSAERESLQSRPQKALEKAIQNTLTIITEIFDQGKMDKTIQCNSSSENMALMFLSFLQGGQLSARSIGGKKDFRKMTQAMLKTLKP